jgi:hypothetical protein
MATRPDRPFNRTARRCRSGRAAIRPRVNPIGAQLRTSPPPCSATDLRQASKGSALLQKSRDDWIARGMNRRESCPGRASAAARAKIRDPGANFACEEERWATMPAHWRDYAGWVHLLNQRNPPSTHRRRFIGLGPGSARCACARAARKRRPECSPSGTRQDTVRLALPDGGPEVALSKLKVSAYGAHPRSAPLMRKSGKLDTWRGPESMITDHGLWIPGLRASLASRNDVSPV